MDQFTMAEFAKNSENKEGASFTPEVQEDGIGQGTLIVSKLYNTMLGEITKYLRSINAELVNVLDEAGISPSALSDEQLYTAIKKIIEQSHGRNVGDVYFSYSSSAADNVGGLPLFTGELISNADNLYPQFYAWLGDHPEVCTTEASWQNAIGTYGECPKYVLNTNNRTIRLPILKNYLKMANTTDGITQKAAGLPNISGNIGDVVTFTPHSSGAFSYVQSQSKQTTSNGSPWCYAGFVLDASLSDSTYGNSNTVTPAHTTLYPWVCVYNEAIPASTAQAAEFQAALSGKMDVGDLSEVQCVVETYKSGNSWYRVYSDGWCEQGGITSSTNLGTTSTVSLLKTMRDTSYTILWKTEMMNSDDTIFESIVNNSSITQSQFVVVNARYTGSGTDTVRFRWMVCGFIA